MNDKEKLMWSLLYMSIWLIFPFLIYLINNIKGIKVIFIFFPGFLISFIFCFPFIFFICLWKDLKISKLEFHIPFLMMEILPLFNLFSLLKDLKLINGLEYLLGTLLGMYPITGSIIGYLSFQMTIKLEEKLIKKNKRTV